VDHIGIDLHKRESQICILTETGEVVERTIQTTRDRLAAVLGTRARARILLEATTESEWVAQCLEGLGHEVIVADPNYAPMYPERRRRVKTNRRDARTLATAARLGAYRPAHRLSGAQRQVRQQLVVRDGLIQTRTRAIAMSGALVRSEGLRIRSGKAEHFQRRLGELTLPPALAAVLAPTRALLTTLNQEIAAADDAIAAIATGDPVVTRLMTVPGVGPVTAAAFVATLDRVDRFAGAHQVESYLGLVPSENSSADRHQRGGITKAGSPRMRWLLVQAAWAVLHATRAEARPLRAWAERIAQRRGKRVATVALARRLAGILFALWRDDTTFDVTRLGRATRRVA
jgi:transposase